MNGKIEELNLDDLDKVAAGGGMSELSETQSMRLQMIMDNESKAVQTLSNIMKHVSSTADQITSNLK